MGSCQSCFRRSFRCCKNTKARGKGAIDEDIPTDSLPEYADGGPVGRYPMDSRPRGTVFIINNFKGEHKGFGFREGNCHDWVNLTNVFQDLQFKVDIRNNLSKQAMKDYCKASANGDFSKDDCVVVVVLTRGVGRDLLMGVDGQLVKLNDLTLPFCGSSTLIGKPKIFIIQACRGSESCEGVAEPDDRNRQPSGREGLPDSLNATGIPNSRDLEESLRYEGDISSGLLPPNSDMIVALSTSEGKISYRHPNFGSWYIKELTEVLRREYTSGLKNTRHLTDVLTEVQGRVSNLMTKDGFVQMPEYRSTLRGPIYLTV